MASVDVNATLGRVGRPAPIRELAARDWDAIVVGGGHNGLTAAAYLARAGRSVLVLERSEQLGGACTLERPFPDPDYLISPCAYVVGLLDQAVVAELGLERHGYRVIPADPALWCPFPDGSSFASHLDNDRTVEHLRGNGFSEADVRGVLGYQEVFGRLRRLLREGPAGDTWKRPSPSRGEIEQILGGDAELISIVFEESIADTLDRHLTDQRLKDALMDGRDRDQRRSPRSRDRLDPPHAPSGKPARPGAGVGVCRGRHGRISFGIAQAALEAGATIACEMPVVRIEPGVGVELETGELIRARSVISNADPQAHAFVARFVRRPLRLSAAAGGLEAGLACGEAERGPDQAAHLHRRRRLRASSCDGDHHPRTGRLPGGVRSVHAREPRIGFAELYFQTAYDGSVAPPGKHVMSVFAQYAPHRLAEGDWDSRRDQIGELILDAIGVYAPDVHDCVEHVQVLGPPDIEGRIGLTGGHIFQGEALPDQMWDRRLGSRTPIDGLYLCGAATHPGGSVIALNGRNAAFAVLEDLGPRLRSLPRPPGLPPRARG